MGVNDVDDCMLRLKDRIKHNIAPFAMGLFDIAEEQKNGCSIVKVTVVNGIEKHVAPNTMIRYMKCLKRWLIPTLLTAGLR